MLVGDLVKVAGGLAPLAVEAADGQVDLLKRAKDLVDLLGLDQAGEVEHDADANAGADVGRAGGQVAELGAEGVGQLFLELVVELVDRVPDFREPEARKHELDAEMVFLVDHDGDVFQRAQGDAARAVAGGQLAGDDLALDQELPVEGRRGR